MPRREIAVHEAGHAVFIWRSHCEMHPEAAGAGFREIEIGRYLACGRKPVLLSGGKHGVVRGPGIVYVPGMFPAARRQARLTRSQLLAEFSDDDCAHGRDHAAAYIATLMKRREPLPSDADELLRGLGSPIVETRAERRAKVRWTLAVAEHTVAFTLAGPMAQAKHMGKDFSFWVELEEIVGERPDNDLVKVHTIAENVRGPCQAGAYIDRLQDKVSQALDDHATWRTILALADALLRRRRLSDEQALRVMRRAWADATG